MYPILLILNTVVAIMICSIAVDQLVSIFLKDEGKGMYLFGLLPALNEDRKTVPDSELIKFSRGFLVLLIAAFVLGFIHCFRDSSQVRSTSALAVTVKFCALFALILLTAAHVPGGIWHDVLIFNHVGFNFAKGIDPSAVTCFFYAGVLAFADGMFPLKIPAIASSHHRSDLPLVLAVTLASLSRWIFCIFASTILVNPELLPIGTFNLALVGVFTYLVFIVIPEIIDE